MDNLSSRLSALLSVKSIVTIALTAVFAFLSLRGGVGQDFMTIYLRGDHRLLFRDPERQGEEGGVRHGGFGL